MNKIITLIIIIIFKIFFCKIMYIPEIYFELIIILEIHCKQLSRISGLVSNNKLLSVLHKLSKAVTLSIYDMLS